MSASDTKPSCEWPTLVLQEGLKKKRGMAFLVDPISRQWAPPTLIGWFLSAGWIGASPEKRAPSLQSPKKLHQFFYQVTEMYSTKTPSSPYPPIMPGGSLQPFVASWIPAVRFVGVSSLRNLALQLFGDCIGEALLLFRA